MALDDAYATPEEAIDLVGEQLQGGPMLDVALRAVSRVIDLKTDNPYGFNKDAAVTTHVYGPNDEIYTIASLTGLVVKVAAAGAAIDWTSVTALVQGTGFELLPMAPLPGHPYTGIRLLNWTATDYRLQITAIHGWPAVPEMAKLACIHLTAMLGGHSIYSRAVPEIGQDMEASGQARGLLKSLTMSLSKYGGIGVG